MGWRRKVTVRIDLTRLKADLAARIDEVRKDAVSGKPQLRVAASKLAVKRKILCGVEKEP